MQTRDILITCACLFVPCFILCFLYMEGMLTQKYLIHNDAFVPSRLYTAPSDFKKLPIVVSITTIPSRIKFVYAALNRLIYHQTRPADYIALVLPQTSLRGVKNTYDIPQSILDLYNQEKRFLIIRPKIDFGPISKILPVCDYFYKERDINCIHVVGDDDQVYSKKWVHTLATASEKVNDCVFTLCGGTIIYNKLRNVWIHINVSAFIGLLNIPVEYVCGFAGMSFTSEIFPSSDIIRYYDTAASMSCLKSDDVIISYFFAANGIKRYRISSSNCYSSKEPSAANTNALCHDHRMHVYNECILRLIKYSYDRRIPFLGLSLQLHREPNMNLSDFTYVVSQLFPGSIISTTEKHNTFLPLKDWLHACNVLRNGSFEEYHNLMKHVRLNIWMYICPNLPDNWGFD